MKTIPLIYFYCTFLILSVCKKSFAQLKLSPSASVSVVTVAPGNDEIYTTFGHSLLVVKDTTQGIDFAYNYGTFDFNTPDFYWRFLKGQLPYVIARYPFPDYFRFNETVEKRGMIEQKLNLSLIQKQRVFDLLETNLLPQNREYQYKFFYDNCATRVRDILLKATRDSLHFNPIAGMNDSTYRQWMNIYLRKKKHYWASVGMNICLGNRADERATQYEACYLPDNLMLSISEMRLLSNSKVYSFSRKPVEIYKERLVKEEVYPFYLQPSFVFSIVLLVVVLITRAQSKRAIKGYWLDQILFGIAGIFGWFLLFLWFGTNHGVTVDNRNILWLFPLNFPFVFFLHSYTNKYLVGITFCILGMMLCGAMFYLAQYNFPTIPLVMALFVRCAYHAGFEPESRVINRRRRLACHGLNL